MRVNVRVIAATNRNLEQAIEKKGVPEDLYYRLNVFPRHLPSPAERKRGYSLLVKHFCQKHEGKIVKKITHIPAKVMTALEAYDWPGNIRELRISSKRALILSRNGSLTTANGSLRRKRRYVPARCEKAGRRGEKSHHRGAEKNRLKVSGERGAASCWSERHYPEARMKKWGIKRE